MGRIKRIGKEMKMHGYSRLIVEGTREESQRFYELKTLGEQGKIAKVNNARQRGQIENAEK
jgi:hypothetical protein